MPRTANVSVENNFSKGLVTEATGLNFPENACTETYDCVFDRTGEVYRRYGLAIEDDSVPATVSVTDSVVSEYTWRAVSKNGEISFLVLQIGTLLYFYRLESVANNISSQLEAFTVNIEDYRIVGSPDAATKGCSFSSGNGLLFVAHPYCDPFYVEYSEDTENITTTEIAIKVRDVKGLDNEDSSGNLLDYEYRPSQSELSVNISYNLLNQGWYAIDSVGQAGGSSQHVLQFYFNQNNPNVYPAESEIWWVYKTPTTAESAENPPAESFQTAEFKNQKNRFGSSPAPKGHYLLDAFRLDRSAAATADAESVNADTGTYIGANIDVTGIAVESSGYQRPSQIAFYAGRVFYAGVNSSGFNTRIYFSQILDGKKNIDRCYQQQDPTAEHASDLLATDGGVIDIPDLATVIKLFTVSNSLYVFATNGIWRISGSEGVGFTALDYSIVKVANTGAISLNSFVDVDGTPFWWNVDDIWTLQSESPVSVPKVVPLTHSVIHTFFDAIPTRSKQYAKGYYNTYTRVIQWLYRSTEVSVEDEVTSHHHYDRVLNLDVSTSAFYPWTLPSDVPYKVVGKTLIEGTTVIERNVDVVAENFDVVADGNEVIAILVERVPGTAAVDKYIVFDTNAGTVQFADIDSETYTDWSDDPVNVTDYLSYFISGYKVRGDAIRKFQSNYIRVYTRNQAPSIFDFHTRWDYSINSQNGRWSSVQRVDTTSQTDVAFGSRKLKARGHGLALNFYVSSVSGQPFNIIGWSSFETGNSSP